MASPAVSVVIVTYNKGPTIGPAIESVLRQTYRDLEILVVDDGSLDDTARRVREFGDRVRYLPKENGGTGSARNLGIAQSRGLFIALLDGDDLWLPRKLEIQMAAFEREPGVVAVHCSAYCVDSQLRVLEARLCDPRNDTLLDFLLFRNLPAFSSAVVIRRSVIQELGGFGTDLVILSDWDMACRLARVGTLRSVPDTLVLYRHYPGNQSRDVGIHIDSGVKSLTRFFAHPSLDQSVRSQERVVWARFYAMLAGGYFRNGQWGPCLRWVWRAIRTSPRVTPYVASMPMRRFIRAFGFLHRISFAQEFPFPVSEG